MIFRLVGLIYLSAMHEICVQAGAIKSAAHSLGRSFKVIFMVHFLDIF